MHSLLLRRTFLRLLKYLQIKEGRPNFGGEPILHNGWISWSTLLNFNFNSFNCPNSSSFLRFQCILDYSGVFFSEYWNFYKLKRGGRFSGVTNSARKPQVFGHPFCIWILKVSRTEILRHWLDIYAFCLIKEYISHTFEIWTS